jgi:hypothetical protein
MAALMIVHLPDAQKYIANLIEIVEEILPILNLGWPNRPEK